MFTHTHTHTHTHVGLTRALFLMPYFRTRLNATPGLLVNSRSYYMFHVSYFFLCSISGRALVPLYVRWSIHAPIIFLMFYFVLYVIFQESLTYQSWFVGHYALLIIILTYINAEIQILVCWLIHAPIIFLKFLMFSSMSYFRTRQRTTPGSLANSRSYYISHVSCFS